ncbi:hypothetical protein CDIK_3167, partial [Cucumispora dikerogammari]
MEKGFCKECKKRMVLREKNVKNDLKWGCLALMCLKREISIRKKIFFGLCLSLKTIVIIFYLWSRDTLIRNIIHELKVSFDSVIAVLDVICLKLKQPENLKIVGLGCIVEVNETKLTKREGNVGKVPKTIWCVGGICRVHKKFFYELVKKKSADILHDIRK